MQKVNILAADVIAKIAAGEVVERPSSVVKELLENAIDAGATRIEIHLKDAGKELIHIIDNGHGISKNNLENLFNRHATSKITNIDDLEKLVSMGFRGEALYSIGAVADVALRSQAANTKDAWALHIRGGKRLELKPSAPLGQGTDIKVTELFFNTPARRKFLKSNASELNQIVTIVTALSLIYPEKHFILSHAGRTLIDLNKSTSRKDRAVDALNLDPSHLIEVSQEFPNEHTAIKAVLSDINIARPRRDMQYLFINNRLVESKVLGFTINDVYRAILPPGVYPVFAISIDLNPSLIDVNIHPTKKEVRISNEQKIASILRHLIEYNLMQHSTPKTIDASMISSGIPAERIVFAPGQLQPTIDFGSRSATELPELNLFAAPSNNSMMEKFAPARYIGAFMQKYLIFENGGSLLLVDQHAAQERIMFERFDNQINNGAIEVQPLLTPILISLSPNERVMVDELTETFKTLGIEAALFDDETLGIHTQPVLLNNIEKAVRTLLAGDDITRIDRTTLARRACKASIVSGDYLSPLQVENQRKELLACKDPFTCPHGRPIVVELTVDFLDRQFLRS